MVLKSVSWGLQGTFKGILWKFKGCFESVLAVFQANVMFFDVV